MAIGIMSMPSDEASCCTPVMPLEGAEALELYLAKIGRNIDAIKEQAALLRTALAARRSLLNELSALHRNRNERPRQVDSSRTS
jgi:hypothetical protein